MSFENQVRSSQGYYELGMLAEAWEELEAIDAEHRDDPLVIQMRLLLLLKEARWEEALAGSEQLIETDGKCAMGYIHAAYCLHEMGQTSKARELLLSGPSSLLREAVYFYNLACYEIALGKKEEAESCLQQSFEMDGGLREVARKDEDLECLWNIL